MNDFAIKIKLSWTINRKKTKLNERTYGDRQTAYWGRILTTLNSHQIEVWSLWIPNKICYTFVHRSDQPDDRHTPLSDQHHATMYTRSDDYKIRKHLSHSSNKSDEVCSFQTKPELMSETCFKHWTGTKLHSVDGVISTIHCWFRRMVAAVCVSVTYVAVNISTNNALHTRQVCHSTGYCSTHQRVARCSVSKTSE